MDARRWIGVVLLWTVGCEPPPPAREPADEPTAGDNTLPPQEPETAEARARAVLADLENYCTEHAHECGAQEQPDAYPDVQVPEASRRYVDDRRRELRSLGITVRWDPGANRYAFERGNAPLHEGDPQSDP